MTLIELFRLLRKHLGLVVALPLAVAAVVGVVSLIMPDQYTASTTMYVLTKSDSNQSSSSTYSDLSAGQMLSNDVTSILKSKRVSDDVASQLGLDSLSGYNISVDSSTTTRVITLSVTGTDPQATADVANAFVADTSKVAQEVMDVQSVNVVDEAVAPTSPSGPKRGLYTLVGLVAGLFAAVAIVVVQDMVDTRVHDSAEAGDLLGVPVVGHFPEVEW